MRDDGVAEASKSVDPSGNILGYPRDGETAVSSDGIRTAGFKPSRSSIECQKP